jgi:hypothetical protein
VDRPIYAAVLTAPLIIPMYLIHTTHTHTHVHIRMLSPIVDFVATFENEEVRSVWFDGAGLCGVVLCCVVLCCVVCV